MTNVNDTFTGMENAGRDDFARMLGWENFDAAWSDAAAGFGTVVNRSGAIYNAVTDAARDKVCGTDEPEKVVETVVREVMVNPGNSVAALAYGGLGAAFGFFVSEAYQSPWVQAAYSNMQERVKRSTDKCMDNAFQAMLGVARHCRNNRRRKYVRFAPYAPREDAAAAQLPNLLPIPLDKPVEAADGEMEDAEQQPVPLEAFHLWMEWYAKCAEKIGCHASEWEREFNLAYMVRDSVWEPLDEQQLLYASQSLSLPVNESMDKRLLVSCLIATTRIYDVDLFPK